MLKTLAAVLGAGALITAGAAPALASAKPAVVHHPKVSAETQMTNRPDSGGGGDWAADDFTRTVVIEQQTAAPLADCGTTSGQCFLIAGAKLNDTAGTFTTIAGAKTPNQGLHPGQVIAGVVHGKMSGNGEFGPFYATSLPDAHKVPPMNDGDANPSGTWPTLAFPAGTAFTGLSESAFSYAYHHGTQDWVDADSNSSGQSLTAGDITG